MQQKKEDFRFFLERTDDLAYKLRITLRELGPVIGMSTASLFGYRSGKIPLSSKAWGKLEAAEKKAGINSVTHDGVSETDSRVSEFRQPPETPVTRQELSEMSAKLDRLTGLVEQLIEQRAATTRQAEATSSSSPGSTSQRKTMKTTRKKLA